VVRVANRRHSVVVVKKACYACEGQSVPETVGDGCFAMRFEVSYIQCVAE